MSVKDFLNILHVNKAFSATGVIGRPASDPYNVQGYNKLRIVIEGVGVTNVVEVYGRLKNQTAWILLDTITGLESGSTLDVKDYDEVYFTCTTYEADGVPALIFSAIIGAAATGGGGGPGTWGSITGTLSDQTDLNTALGLKAPLTSPNFATSARFGYGTANVVPYWNASKDLVASAVTPTELGYLSGVTSAIQTQLAARPTGSGASGRIAYWSGASTLGSDGSFLYDATNVGLRIGVTGILARTKERISGRFSAAAGDTAGSAAVGYLQYLNSNDAVFTSINCVLELDFRRTISTSQTDTSTGNALLRSGGPLFTVGAATYTIGSFRNILVAGPTKSGAGTLAIGSYLGIEISASSDATGTRKTGLFVGAQSGASHNAAIADNVAYTGNWQLHLADTTNPSHIQGDVRIGSTALNALSTEKVTIADTRTGDANSHSGLHLLSTYSGNTAFSVAGNGILGAVIGFSRTITASTTDTMVRGAALMATRNFTVSSGTYTNAQTNGITGIAVPAPSLTGTIAITHLSAIFIGTQSTTNTGTTYGLRIGDQSGSSVANFAMYSGTGAVSFGDYLELRANHDPGAPTDAVRISGKVSTDTGTPNTLHLRTEQAVEAIGTFTASNKLRVWINNVEYWIQLDAV